MAFHIFLLNYLYLSNKNTAFNSIKLLDSILKIYLESTSVDSRIALNSEDFRLEELLAALLGLRAEHLIVRLLVNFWLKTKTKMWP